MARTEALKQGYTIDDYCAPPLAYKGARFRPVEHHNAPTEAEEKLRAALQVELEESERLGLTYRIKRIREALACNS